MSDQNERLIWADSLKGLLIIFVIIGHAIQVVLNDAYFNNHVFNIIYSFHMPAFMAVSGWFAYKSDKNMGRGVFLTFIKRRCYQLLIPYLIWSIIAWCIRGCQIEKLPNIILQPDTYFWFLWVLFWICCIFTFCQWTAEKLKVDKFIPIGTMGIILMGIMVGLDFRMFGFQFLSYYFLFFTLGYCIRRFSILQINKNIMIVALAVLWAVLAWFWNMHELPSWMPAIPHVPASLVQYAYRGSTAAVAMLVIFGIAPKTNNYNNPISMFIKELGVISLGLYVVHLMSIGYILGIVNQILSGCPTWGQISIVFSFAFLGSVIVVKLLMKNRWTAKFLLGKV